MDDLDYAIAEDPHKLGKLHFASLLGAGADQGTRKSVSPARIYDNTSVAWQDRRTENPSSLLIAVPSASPFASRYPALSVHPRRSKPRSAPVFSSHSRPF